MARSIVRFDESFTSVMGVVGRVVDFTDRRHGLRRGRGSRRLPAAPAPDRAGRHRGRQGAPPRGHRGAARRDPLRQGPGPALRPGRQPSPAPKRRLSEASRPSPSSTGGRLAGLLAVGGKGTARLSGDVELLLAQAANQAYIVLENSRLFERIRNLSIRDSLTDLYNHKHTMDLVANEVGRVGRYEGGVSLAMVDIDKFKQINDAHGHQAGDVVLRDVARILRDTLRNVDSLGRYGGEEFAAILPHTGLQGGAPDRRAHPAGGGRPPLPHRPARAARDRERGRRDATRRRRSTPRGPWFARPTRRSIGPSRRDATGSASPQGRPSRRARAPCYSRVMAVDDRARVPADVPVPEMERLLSLALAPRRRRSPTSTSSTSARPRCSSRRGSSARPRRE